ncbi:hypothetical protein QSV36_02670 [Pseudomonas sp. BCRC 81390]|uniref:hypothetical protein n=1 Tax=Pseudomonas sp. BCRC 81390 TaxID=3054778 RepID=UPI00259A92D8|nr:hypothetical protein [Pseudomonas sp. BCRC 81390]MDM3884511.1 hypothetical protein [Pseudomonas sp. BCRC 81390]
MLDTDQTAGNTTAPASDAGALLLDELSIPGATGPVPSGEWGVNLAAAHENFPRNGLQVYVPAWPRMGRGDRVRLLLGSDEVDSTQISEGQENQRQTLFVPPVHLQTGVAELSYRVKRLGQVEEPSAVTAIYVKLERPGGQDQDGSNPGHSELKFTLPDDVVQDGVDMERARQGVEVTILPYPFMAEHDKIRLSWGGQFVYHSVTQSEANDDNPVVILVEEAVILEAGDSDEKGLAVAFEVYDLVDNRSEDWSAEQRVVVDTGNARLAAGIVKEAKNNVLDLELLGDADATLQVVAFSEPFAVDDTIVAYLSGETEDGRPVNITYPPKPIDSVPGIVEITIANEDVRQLAKTQAKFSYELVKSVAARRAMDAQAFQRYEQQRAEGSYQSRGQFVTIQGEAVRLAAPRALDAEQGTLDPALLETTIEVPWDSSMQASDVINLIWEGEKPDLTPYFPAIPVHDISNGEAERKEPIRFTVDGKHLKAIEGGKLVLLFMLERGGQSPRRSERTVTFSVGEPRAELDKPTVNYAEEQGNGEWLLDPEKVPVGGTKLVVQRYARIKEGDVLFFSWKGKDEDASLEDSLPITASNIGREQFELTISKALVSANDGHEVVASYRVERVDGGLSYSEPLTLRVGMFVPLITSVEDAEDGPIADQGSTYETTVTLTGRAKANEQIQIFDGVVAGETVQVNGEGAWTTDLHDLVVGSHPIKAKALYGDKGESAVWTFNVLAQVEPTIERVMDAYGEVTEGGTTFATEVTVAGKATPNRQIILNDREAPVDNPKTDPDGDWSTTLSSLEATAHRLQAVAQYGDGSSSKPFTFTVEAATKPIITNVTDSSGTPVENGGQTHLADLTLEGTAHAGQQVQVLVDGEPGDTATAIAGNWQLSVTGLSKAPHTLVVKGIYGAQPQSEPWRVEIVDVPALQIDSTPMLLETRFEMFVYYSGTELFRPGEAPSGSFETRRATGGVPPLTYRSSAPDIARVDENSGLVESFGNGRATITVEDSLVQQAGYEVVVSNVIQFLLLPEATFAEGQESRLGSNTILHLHSGFGRARLESFGLLKRYWSSTASGIAGKGLAIDFVPEDIELHHLSVTTRLPALGPRQPGV